MKALQSAGLVSLYVRQSSARCSPSLRFLAGATKLSSHHCRGRGAAVLMNVFPVSVLEKLSEDAECYYLGLLCVGVCVGTKIDRQKLLCSFLQKLLKY